MARSGFGECESELVRGGLGAERCGCGGWWGQYFHQLVQYQYLSQNQFQVHQVHQCLRS